MTATAPVLPPMLARMPRQGLLCTYGGVGYCDETATVEVMTLWPDHQDDNLVRLAETHMKPRCEKHLGHERDICCSVVDGSMFIVRRLVASR